MYLLLVSIYFNRNEVGRGNSRYSWLLGGDNFIIKLRHSTKHYFLGEHLPIVVMVVVISGVTVVGLAVLVGGAAVVVASVGFTMF